MTQDVIGSVIDQPDEALEQATTLLDGPPPFDSEPPDHDGGGDSGGDDGEPNDSPISNARLGMIILLGAETMFFAGLVGSFLVFRVAHEVWPPPTFPRLPIVVTGINTLFLLYSALTMWQANRSIHADDRRRCVQFLSFTVVLGVVFLAIQGYEWLQLISFGLRLSSGVYGATFYVLIGCHALHVLGAVIWVGVVLAQAMRGRYSARGCVGVVVCGMYWHYVVALWPVLYWLVYLY